MLNRYSDHELIGCACGCIVLIGITTGVLAVGWLVVNGLIQWLF